MVIRRVSPWSLAKVAGVLQGAMGLVVGLMFSLIGAAIAGLGNASPDTELAPFGGAMMGAMFGVGAVVILPVVYGVLGFITGAVVAFIYNLVAGAIGGIEIDVDASPVPRVN